MKRNIVVSKVIDHGIQRVKKLTFRIILFEGRSLKAPPDAEASAAPATAIKAELLAEVAAAMDASEEEREREVFVYAEKQRKVYSCSPGLFSKYEQK